MKRVVLLIVLALFTGCVNPNFIEPVKIKKDKMAVSFILLKKNIKYSETLYRVLYLETKSSVRDISGVWDIDKDLSLFTNKMLLKKGNLSTDIYSILDENTLSSYRNGLIVDYFKDIKSRELEPGIVIPAKTKQYLLTYPKNNKFKILREKLLSKGVTYLFEYIAPFIDASAPGYGMVMIGMTSNLRIINLKTEKVEWVDTNRIFENYQLGGNLKKVEENNLELLRKSIKSNIEKLFEKIVFQ